MVLLQVMQRWCRLLELGVQLVGLQLRFVLVWLLLLLVLERVVVRFLQLCYAPLLIFGAHATYLSHFVSSMTAYHLCVLPARLSALPDSFRT